MMWFMTDAGALQEMAKIVESGLDGSEQKIMRTMNELESVGGDPGRDHAMEKGSGKTGTGTKIDCGRDQGHGHGHEIVE